jgi:acetolactate synthase-1/3 small subunit
MSRMTLQMNVDDVVLEQMTKQLNKLIEVLKIVELEGQRRASRTGPGQGQGHGRDPGPS